MVAGAVQAESKLLHYVTRLVVGLVAVGAAILSFDALTELAKASGIRSEFSWMWAVVIDGFILVATLATFALQNRSRSSRYYAWITLGLFVIFSILGNAWHAAIARTDFVLPIWVSVIVTAVPPLALFLAIHLLVIMVSPTDEQKEEFARQANKRERLRKIEEKELEKIEKEAIAKDIREATAAAKRIVAKPVGIVSPVSTPATPVPVTAAPQLNVAQNVPKETATQSKSVDISIDLPNTPLNETPQATSEKLTESEVIEKMKAMQANGESLPTGRAVAEWLGKSDRTGQNLVKKFKSEFNLV